MEYKIYIDSDGYFHVNDRIIPQKDLFFESKEVDGTQIICIQNTNTNQFIVLNTPISDIKDESGVSYVDADALISAIGAVFKNEIGITSTPTPQNVIVNDENGDPINENNPLPISQIAKIDPNNSTTTTLGVDETFTGDPTNILGYAGIGLNIISDQSSATGGLTVQFSKDNATWFNGESYTIEAGRQKFFTPPKQSAYFRISYKNGSVAQASFDLHVILSKTPFKWSSHNIDSQLSPQDDAELGVIVLKAQDETGAWVVVRAIQGDTGYNLKVSLDQTESTTNSVQVINYDHAELHDGRAFHCGAIDDDLDAGDTLVIAFKTPNTIRWSHLIPEISNTSGSLYELLEAPTIDVGTGTVGNILNRNRNSLNASGMLSVAGVANQFTINPTMSDDGLVIDSDLISAGKEKISGASRGEHEWLLKQNTLYALRVTGQADNGKCSINLNWYEHINK